MICFEVHHDGTKLCTAGIGYGVLNTLVYWVSHRPEKLAQWAEQGHPPSNPEELWLRVGGLGRRNLEDADEHRHWGAPTVLSEGDEVRVRILQREEPDAPNGIPVESEEINESRLRAGSPMICFEVSRNGERLFTAGIGEFGVMIAMVTLDSLRREQVASWAERGEPVDPEAVSLTVTGKDRSNPEEPKSVRWINSDLAEGDEVRIRIVRRREADPPNAKLMEE